jgi:Predicted pPIWI-associating nuclease
VTAIGKAPTIYTVEEANAAMNRTIEAAVSTALKPRQFGSMAEIDHTERQILDKLRNILPSAAASYNQAVLDLKEPARQSMRGTAMELREALREVLDHLAPDNNVQGAQRFKFEPGMSKPTMRQKAHFILQSREHASSTAKAPEDAVGIAEELIASFIRSVYQVGAVEGHVASNHSRVTQLKKYVDVALSELLNTG